MRQKGGVQPEPEVKGRLVVAKASVTAHTETSSFFVPVFKAAAGVSGGSPFGTSVVSGGRRNETNDGARERERRWAGRSSAARRPDS